MFGFVGRHDGVAQRVGVKQVPRWILFAGIAGAMAITGTALAAGTHTQAPPFPYGHPGPGSKPERVIRIQALDALRFQPAHITVRRGETVRFVITNTGKLAHEFVIGNAAVQAAHQREMQAMPGMSMQHDMNAVSLPPGATRDLVWTFTRDGTVEYACHEPGHFAAGMVGTIDIVSTAKRH